MVGKVSFATVVGRLALDLAPGDAAAKADDDVALGVTGSAAASGINPRAASGSGSRGVTASGASSIMPSMTPSIADCHFRSSRRSRSASERGGRRARVDEGEASVVSDTVVLVSRRSSELILALRRRRVAEEGKNCGVVVAGAASRRRSLLDGDWFGEGVLSRSSSGTSRDFGGGVDGRASGSGATWSLRGRGGTGGGRDATDGAFDGLDAGTALTPVADDGSVYGRTSAAASRVASGAFPALTRGASTSAV